MMLTQSYASKTAKLKRQNGRNCCQFWITSNLTRVMTTVGESPMRRSVETQFEENVCVWCRMDPCEYMDVHTRYTRARI